MLHFKHVKESILFGFLFPLSSLSFSQVTEDWVRNWNDPSNQEDIATSIAADDAGNVYVTGHSRDKDLHINYVTIKYDWHGNELWIKTFKDGSPTSIALDGVGNVYVTGRSKDDIATVKYDSTGNELWVKRYSNGNASALDSRRLRQCVCNWIQHR